MPSIPIALRLALGLALLAPASALGADPQFALVSWTSPPNASGSSSWDEVPCATGELAAGVPVVLLARDGRRCTGATREVTEGIAGGRCTRVEPAASCDTRGLEVVVVGRTEVGTLRILKPAPLAPARLSDLAQRVTKSGLLASVAASGRRWNCQAPIVFAPGPSEGFVFEGLVQGPIFLRYPVAEGGGKASYPGTLLTVSGASVGAPFDVHAIPPFAFTLEGAAFVVGGSSCGDCGLRLDQVFAVEGGQLRLLYQTSALST